MSGIPPAYTAIGCVSFNLANSGNIFSQFQKKLKNIYNKKGKDLKPNDLEKILIFFENNKIRSLGTDYNTNNWNTALHMIPKDKSFPVERLCGIVYYLLLEKCTKPKIPCFVHLCIESHMDINYVKTTLRRIAKMRDRDFNITIGTGKYDKAIKMADYIASATKNVKSKKLLQYQYYTKIKTKVPKLYIKKAFR